MTPFTTFARGLAGQLARPHGLWGRLVGALMNRANAAINRQSIELLTLSPDDEVLEIGFGGGATLRYLLRLASRGRVYGLEKSATMLTAAEAAHRDALASGGLQLRVGDASQLPWDRHAFDRVLSVNTLYFWDDPRAVFAEVHRVLKPDGRFVLAYRPREMMDRLPTSRHGFRLYDDQTIIQLLRAGGMDVLSITHGGRRGHEHTCVVATPFQRAQAPRGAGASATRDERQRREPGPSRHDERRG
jgi:SAM-dependent methyltransferase